MSSDDHLAQLVKFKVLLSVGSIQLYLGMSHVWKNVAQTFKTLTFFLK